MISRKELEELGIVMTDAQWEEHCKQMAEIQEQMWAEGHPLDD